MANQQQHSKIAILCILFALLLLGIQDSLAAERWQVVILPDNSQTTPAEVSLYTDTNLIITRGLTQVLSAADFDVHNGSKLNLPDCKFADCSATDPQKIREAAQQFDASLNLALLYQFKAFKQRQNSETSWHFSLTGRLLDLENGLQLDAFEATSRANEIAQNCIAECANNWLSQQLNILSQDLGAVLAEKLAALPRREHYTLQMQDFSLPELQHTLTYLQNLDTYVADTLLREYDNKTEWLQDVASRDYQYISEASSSLLGSSLAHFMDEQGMQVNITYRHAQRQFTLQRRAASNLVWYSGLAVIVLLLCLGLIWRYSKRQQPVISHNNTETLNQQNHNNSHDDSDIGNINREQSAETHHVVTPDDKIRTSTNKTPIWLFGLLVLSAGIYWRYYFVDGSRFIADLLMLPNQQAEPVTPTEIETPSSTEPTPEQLAALQDDNDWQQATRINTLQSYQHYLNRWPEGRYFLSASAALQVIADDEAAWQAAINQGTSEAYQRYLSDKPDGLYQQRALQRLTLLFKHSQHTQKLKDTLALADDYYYQQKNYVDARYYYQQAAELDSALAQFQLGQIYSQAQGTNKNERLATHWYQKAAEQGHAQAQFKLAYRFSKGLGVSQDHQQAIHWYQQAAEQGVSLAQYNLAYIYAQGQVTRRDYQQAAYWYQKAAEQGDADAQYNLGKLYENGQGVGQDFNKAKRLYRQSAAQGNQLAKISLTLLKD